MVSIDRLKEMALEELETELNNWKEQVELQSNFIDSLLKATNNSEWLNKTILDDEASEIIEKIELDYVQLDELKAENEELKGIRDRNFLHALEEQEKADKLKQTLTELGTILTHCMQQDICTTCDYSEQCNLGDEEIPTYDICKFILNKIKQHQ